MNEFEALQLRAADRTTHAVRSIAVFIVWQFAASLLGAVSIAWGFFEESDWGDGTPFFAFGVLIIAVGTIAALIKSFAELRNSEVPRN